MTDLDNINILKADMFLTGGRYKMLGEHSILKKGFKIFFDEATVTFISGMVNLRKWALSDFEFDIYKNDKGTTEYAIFYASCDPDGDIMYHPLKLSTEEAKTVMNKINACFKAN